MVNGSATMFNDYTACKRKALYRIQHIRQPDTASLIFGRIVHDYIDNYEKGEATTLEECKQLLVRELSVPGIKFYRWQKLAKMLPLVDTCFNNYLAVSKQLPTVTEAEYRFKVKYSPEANIVGKFDQLREGDVILELKTSHSVPTLEYLCADNQATTYIWAYQELFGVVPRYYYLHLPSGIVYELFRDRFGDMLAVMKDLVRDYKEHNFPRQRDGYRCSKCDFYDHCYRPGEDSEVAFTAKDVAPKSKPRAGHFF